VYETVYSITEWYDGARGGVADFGGVPHYYENRWNDEQGDWDAIYFLQPLDAETFELAMEDWGIWLRWEQAYKEGRTPHETHPALPEDRDRHNELRRILAARLTIAPATSIKAKAEFKYGEPTLVAWEAV
jgi:hypothetical protein